MRSKDIEQLMSVYEADVVYFDLVPPLQYVGAAALRARFVHWFSGWTGSIGMEMSDLAIMASDEVAAASMLLRASGTRVGGSEVGYWVRTSNSCRRSERGWLIAHEHVSLPVDVQTGSAVMDLVP
jgi:ketosteroid isomerase-like protein